MTHTSDQTFPAVENALNGLRLNEEKCRDKKGNFVALNLGATNNRVLLMTCSENPEPPPRKVKSVYQIPTDIMLDVNKSVS